MYLPTITIVTPCLNAVETIDQTLASVLNQAGAFHLHYHVQDGGSTDGTWERVQWWKHHVASTHFISHCKEILFTAAQEQDTGLYDAIVKGFAKTNPARHAFMAWINADDLLFQGSLALIADFETQFPSECASWVGGANAIVKGSRLISFWDTPIPTSALLNGLCEGTHWDFLQQEGVFFRGWLWREVGAPNWLPEMRLAGDWNLWRLFAQHASLVQCNYPLGAFRLREGQLSGTQRENYLEEIDSIVFPEVRKRKLGEIVEACNITRRLARSCYPNTTIRIYEEDIHSIAEDRYIEVFGKCPQSRFSLIETKLLFEGEEREFEIHTINSSDLDVKENLKITKQVFAYDADWQIPAITEKLAYENIKRLWRSGANSAGYVAFPWATAIDHLQAESPQAAYWFRLLHRFADRLEQEYPAHRRVTVCQHIKLKEYMPFFKACGITDIFWSHCTRSDAQWGYDGVDLHPFPLYPVQQLESPAPHSLRDLVFSFVGALADKFYLSESRDWIFQHMQGKPGGFLGKRDSWHYADIVYNKQIGRPLAAKATTVADEKEFRELLSRSIFSLCPSGTGPNSIRLWESLGAGAIPVILSDTYLPPGPFPLWEEAAVFCPETEEAIAALPAKLEAMAKDTALLEKKRQAMKCLWQNYGPECFVYDVLKFLIESDTPAAPVVLSPDSFSTANQLLLAKKYTEALAIYEALHAREPLSIYRTNAEMAKAKLCARLRGQPT